MDYIYRESLPVAGVRERWKFDERCGTELWFTRLDSDGHRTADEAMLRLDEVSRGETATVAAARGGER